MSSKSSTDQSLRAEVVELRARLAEAEDMLGAIRAGEVDALVVEGDAGPRLFTLQGLDAEQNRLRGEMLAQVSDAVIAVDLNERITFLNAAAERQYGVRATDALGRSLSDVYSPVWPSPGAEAVMQTSLRERGDWRGELRQRTHGGREFDVETTVTVLRDSHGAPMGLLIAVRDITARKRTDETFRQNAALFSTLIAQAPMGTYVVDAQFRMRQINAEAMPAFASVQPLIGRDFHEVLHILWGPDVGGQIAGIFQRTLDTGERYVSPPFTERRQDLGIEQSYEWETQRITLPDGQFGVVCYFHEVTERAHAVAALQASTERLRLAAEATGIGVWEWNLRTNRIKWDAQMFRLYGIAPTPDGYVEYSDWSTAVLPEELAANEAILQDTVRRRGRSTRTFRIRRRHDGACRDITAVETVRAGSDGEPEWVLGTNLDVTDRRRANDDLRRLAADLAEADHRKDAFLATLSHELRNPLAAIRNGIYLLRRIGDDRAKVEQNRLRLERQVAMLVRLLDDLMDVSRISQDKLTLQTQRLDLASIVRRAIETSQPFLDRRERAVSVTLPSEPIAVDGDATRLVQVLGNLLTNAAKYSDSGSPISLTVEPHGQVAEVRVRDRGIGIASADLPRIFEMFAQIDSSRERAHGGLGIGLHLVRRLVEMHGGSVEARSEGLGQGSEFVVRLPRALATLPDPTPDGEPQEVAPPEPRALRVLIADDNEDAANTLADLITELGHDVRVAGDGSEAVALAASMLPDVALLDIGMPKLTGDEAGRRIRAQPGGDQVVLIAVTGWGQDEDRARSRAAGFDHHLVKPVDPVALATLLRSLAPASLISLDVAEPAPHPDTV